MRTSSVLPTVTVIVEVRTALASASLCWACDAGANASTIAAASTALTQPRRSSALTLMVPSDMRRLFAGDVALIVVLAIHVGLPAAASFPKIRTQVAPFRLLRWSQNQSCAGTGRDSAADCASASSAGTVYSMRSFLAGRLTPTVTNRESGAGVVGLPRSLERDAPRIAVGDFAGLAQQQRQRADGRRQRDLLAVGDVDFERHRLDHGRLFGALLGELVDGKHARILYDDVVGRGVLVALPRQHTST